MALSPLWTGFRFPYGRSRAGWLPLRCLLFLCTAMALAGCTSQSSPPSVRASAEPASTEERGLRSRQYTPKGQIAFFRGDQAQSVFMAAVGERGLERLTSPPEYSSAIAWAPDGSRFAYDVGLSKGGFGLLRIVNVTTGAERTLARGRRTSEPSWSPVDDRIAVRGGSEEIWLVDVGTGKYRRLTTTRPVCGDSHPTWSPSGQSLVFMRECLERSWLMRLDLDGSDPVRLSGTAGATGPAWSPRGHRIAFRRTFERTSQIYVVSIEGGRARRLTRGGESFDPAWSPDGRFLAMLGKRAGNADIWVMRLNDGRWWPVTKNRAWESHPAWRPATD
jgi:TolB protein